MRAAARLTAAILMRLKKEAGPGVTTLALNNLAEEACRAGGAVPAFLGYAGYPFSLCASVNEQVIHGFPGKRKLREGDVLSLDFGVVLDGFVGDAAVTLPIGRVSDEGMKLIRVTAECLDRAVEQARPGNRLGDVSHAVQRHAESNGFSVVRQFVGHGIGRNMHEPPQIPNFGPPRQGVELRPGMVLAIEPMINAGTHKVRILKDGWTAVTEDGRLSAHFEHTVAVTENGPEVLSSFEGLEA